DDVAAGADARGRTGGPGARVRALRDPRGLVRRVAGGGLLRAPGAVRAARGAVRLDVRRPGPTRAARRDHRHAARARGSVAGAAIRRRVGLSFTRALQPRTQST